MKHRLVTLFGGPQSSARRQLEHVNLRNSDSLCLTKTSVAELPKHARPRDACAYSVVSVESIRQCQILEYSSISQQTTELGSNKTERGDKVMYQLGFRSRPCAVNLQLCDSFLNSRQHDLNNFFKSKSIAVDVNSIICWS